MQSVNIETYQENGYKIYRVPSILCTPRGTVIVCYECRYGGDWSAMDLVIRRSTDGGRTWSDRIMIGEGHGIDAVHNGILFADGERTHLVYHRNYRHAYHVTSMDDGVTWSAPQEITYAYDKLRARYPWTVIAAGPGSGLTTSGGRMIIPVWVSSNRELITSHHPSVVTTLYSDDHGQTWDTGEILWDAPDFVDPNESLIAELSDGRYMLNCRHETGTGVRKVGYSPDGISGWGGFYFDPAMKDPVCAAGMTQHGHTLWFVNCRCERSEGRRNLTLRRSTDDGQSWSSGLVISETGGYSDITSSPDGRTLWVIAETGRTDPNSEWTFGLSCYTVQADEVP